MTLSDTGTVNVYDAATAALVDAITVGGLPNFITFTPDGSKAYVSCYQGPPPQVVAIRTSDNAVLATRTFEGNTIQDAVVSPDGSRVYISNMDRQRIEVIRTSDDTVLTPIPTAHLRPRGIGISPDGAYLFVGYYLAIDALIEMIRLSDNAVVSSVCLALAATAWAEDAVRFPATRAGLRSNRTAGGSWSRSTTRTNSTPTPSMAPP